MLCCEKLPFSYDDVSICDGIMSELIFVMLNIYDHAFNIKFKLSFYQKKVSKFLWIYDSNINYFSLLIKYLLFSCHILTIDTGTRNTEHGTRNTEHGTRNTEHGTRGKGGHGGRGVRESRKA